jgi:hypothetical protein
MRRALVFVVFLAACAVEHRGPVNLQVFAPRQLDGASIVVDGKQTGELTPGDPLLDVARQLLGHKRTFVSGVAHVAKGAHTLRIAKQGFEPIERTIDVGDATVIQVCAVDVRPTK